MLTTRRRVLGLAFALACVTLSTAQPPAAPDKAPPTTPTAPPTLASQRAKALAKGINLTHWFWLPIGGEKNFGTPDFFTADDAKAIAKAGFTCVRLPVDPTRLFSSTAGIVNTGVAKKLDKAIDTITEAGLAVVIDLHALGTQSEDQYDKALIDDTKPVGKKAQEAVLKNWTALAKHLATRDPAKVYLELLNEPIFEKKPERWPQVQSLLLAAVRAEAPGHTIILTGVNYSSIDGLVSLPEPLTADDNVIYTFHFYEPHTFTHQGATWGSPNWALLTGLPYPSSPELVKDIAEKITDRSARAEAEWYGKQNWNASKIDARITKAADWAKKHNAVLWCGEFGVINKAPADSRANWLRDVRTGLDQHGIGWCMWDWAGNFGITTTAKPESGQRTLDQSILHVLGLE